MIIKSQIVNAKSDLLNTIVDKIYNLIFGYLDSLFDDANYEKEETTIPKSQVKTEEQYVDAKGQKIDPEDFVSEETDEPADYTVEVAGDGRSIHMLPIEVEGKETPDEFTIETAPIDFLGSPMIQVKVINNTTGKTSRARLVHEDDQQEIADAISAARPGARRETVDNYVKRLENLEAIAEAFPGVEKAYAIQAGRELRILVNNEKIPDSDVKDLARNIAKQIETDLRYPGRIRLTMIRETRIVEYAR